MMSFYFNYYKRRVKSIRDRRSGKLVASDFSQIGLINPAIGTSNTGDLIIADAVYRHLRSVFKSSFFTHYPSHLHTDYDSKIGMYRNSVVFVGGSNLLSSRMDDYYQWKLDPSDKYYLKNKTILMGVGWWQYEQQPNSYTRHLLKDVLSGDYVHSVRDNYTADMLKSIGIDNVINTSCPTLWDISPEICSGISTRKAPKVVTTLTFYRADEAMDRKLLEILCGHYEEVCLWIQGVDDLAYLKRIFPDYEKITLIPPTIESFTDLLESPDIEYIGTRLHAGIRAIQKGKRALIVGVDNRAREISKDTNLNVVDRQQIEGIMDFIEKDYITQIQLPAENIRFWKNQFIK